MTAVVEIQNLVFGYAAQPPVFRDLTLHVTSGHSVSVIGPSGCGKTTLLYLIAGLQKPLDGKVRVFGQPVDRPRPQTGLVLQDHGLLPWANVRSNVALGLKIRLFYGPDGRHAPRSRPLGRQEAEAVVDTWIKRLELQALAAKYPAQLSRGQRQRVALARTLCLQPDLLLLDEPFSALDLPTRESLQQAVLTLQVQTGFTLMIVTHDIQVAAGMGQSVIVLSAKTGTATVIENPAFDRSVPARTPAVETMCERLRMHLGAA